jgi:hypothetical protein
MTLSIRDIQHNDTQPEHLVIMMSDTMLTVIMLNVKFSHWYPYAEFCNAEYGGTF